MGPLPIPVCPDCVGHTARCWRHAVVTVTIPAITVPATIITPVHPNIVLPQPLPYEPWRGPVFVEP